MVADAYATAVSWAGPAEHGRLPVGHQRLREVSAAPLAHGAEAPLRRCGGGKRCSCRRTRRSGTQARPSAGRRCTDTNANGHRYQMEYCIISLPHAVTGSARSTFLASLAQARPLAGKSLGNSPFSTFIICMAAYIATYAEVQPAPAPIPVMQCPSVCQVAACWLPPLCRGLRAWWAPSQRGQLHAARVAPPPPPRARKDG